MSPASPCPGHLSPYPLHQQRRNVHPLNLHAESCVTLLPLFSAWGVLLAPPHVWPRPLKTRPPSVAGRKQCEGGRPRGGIRRQLTRQATWEGGCARARGLVLFTGCRGGHTATDQVRRPEAGGLMYWGTGHQGGWPYRVEGSDGGA